MADFGLLGAETARQRVGGGSSTSERPEDVKRLQQLAVGEVRKYIKNRSPTPFFFFFFSKR